MAQPGSESSLLQLRRRLIGSQTQAVARSVIPTPFEDLNELLPQRGLPAGSLIEWISAADGIGATTIALRCVTGFLHAAGAVVVVDPRHDFHPASVGHLGIPMSRMLLIRPQERLPETHGAAGRCRAESLWALEQAARCSGVRIILTWIDRLSSTAQRRLQLAVENSGVTIFVIRPMQALRQNSWADLRFLVQTDVESTSAGALKVRLIRSKNALLHHGVALLEYDDETGDVSQVFELANSATAARTTE